MAAKKPSAKATKAKKTGAKKTESVKKAAPKKAAPRSKTHARSPAKSQSAGKGASKGASKPAAKAPAKPAKAAPAHSKNAVKAQPSKPQAKIVRPTAVAVAVKPSPRPSSSPFIRATIPATSVTQSQTDIDAADDDGEAPETLSANLLAGPRNVKPYIPRRGEQYMSKEQLDHFRQILNTWKRDLMEEVDRTVLHMKDEAANFPDPNDRATQESEFSLELRTRDRERKLIRKIEEAIKRIEDGTYGYCVETGEEIGIKRLEARPVATLCIEAQERRERREKQYGDRDDRYR
jgi:DnaK suppressor protein